MRNNESPRRLINSTELAEWIGVPVATLAQWVYRGDGPPFIKVGRHRRYDPDAVRRWLDDQTRPTNS